MGRHWLVLRLLRWLRAIAGGVQRLSVRAARRASTSALQRFTLAQCAAAIALSALVFALLVARKLSLTSGKPATDSDAVAPSDAGAPRDPDVRDAAHSNANAKG